MNAQAEFARQPDEPGRVIVERAVAWYLLLQSPEAGAAERAACVDWRAESALHELAWQRICKLWGDFEPARTAPARAAVDTALLVPARRRARVRRSVAALSVFFAIGFGIAMQRDWFADYRTDNASVRTFELADQSRITLDAGSAVDVILAADRRRIVLHRGQILVDVAHDALRPFVVETPQGSARALGTRYVVARHADQSRVTVLESNVRVCPATTAAECVDLRPGEQVDLSLTATGTVATVDIDAATAWQHNRLAVDDAPVSEVLAALQRHRSGRIHFDADALAAVRVSGVFPLDDTDRALEVLASTLPLRVERYTSLLVVVKLR